MKKEMKQEIVVQDNYGYYSVVPIVDNDVRKTLIDVSGLAPEASIQFASYSFIAYCDEVDDVDKFVDSHNDYVIWDLHC